MGDFFKRLLGMPINIWRKRDFSEPFTVIKSVDIELVGKCNLNCKGCNHFSPIAEEGEISIEQLERDLKQLHDVLGERIKSINLLGGEPLLHSNISKIMSITRSIFADTRILILTNGILLKNVDESFWIDAAKNKIDIEITKYPINVDYSKIRKIGLSYGVKVEFFGKSGYVTKTLFTLPIDIHGRQNKEESFNECYMARTCITLNDGKLYPCSYAAYIYRFNNTFDEKIPITKNDYANIYDMDEEQIMDIIGNPIPLCAYCNTKSRTYGNRWCISERSKEEWT